MEEKEFILESARRLERWENTPRPVPDGYADMNRDELIKLAVYQRERLEESDAARKKEREESAGRISALTAQVSELTAKLSELTEQLRKNNESMSAMTGQVFGLMKQLKEKDVKIAELQSTVKAGRRHLFGRKSQKGTRNKDDENRPTPHTDVKGGFDGTPESLPGNLDVDMADKTTDVAGVPGTHAAPDMMAHLVFNRFFLDTPVYRETARLLQERMRLSRQTVTNWLEKGSRFFRGAIEYLKDNCLEKDSVVNCDETWCRVKAGGKYRKRYVWCLVNKAARTAVYYYEDGSRGRKALKEILEGRELRALQTDGYNVYLYLDDEMPGIDHVCCMAHVRAKFKYAAEMEHDVNARKFLEYIGRLYALEKRYIELKLCPEEIRRRRNSTGTTEIIIGMRSLLDLMKSENAPRHGSLMEKAVRYLDHFWNQVFLYRKDGDYTIDNSLAERCIRPLANERKNSLFFGSDKMARVSAAYHSIVSTCKLQGYSILEYLKKFFAEIVAGNRDYGKLMPSTIGISANKL